MRDKRELVRIVRTPDGRIEVDTSGRRPGRGAYVCHQDACISQAITKGALGRALKTSLPTEVRDLLAAGATTDMIIEGGARGQK